MISTGTVEGISNRLKVITRRAYGFRTYRAIEVALYHTLGKLPICRAYPPIDSTDERKKKRGGSGRPEQTNQPRCYARALICLMVELQTS